MAARYFGRNQMNYFFLAFSKFFYTSYIWALEKIVCHDIVVLIPALEMDVPNICSLQYFVYYTGYRLL